MKYFEYCELLTQDTATFKVYFNIKIQSSKLFILFPGAYDRSKGTVQFQRHSWAKDIDGHVVIFDDPTIHETNDIEIGWFQANAGTLEAALIACIRNIIQELSIEESSMRLFGTSAGGFTSLRLSNNFLESDVIVINPQTNVTQYIQRHYEKILQQCYGCNATNQLSDQYLSQLKWKPNSTRNGSIFYFQNLHDDFHFNKHFAPVLDGLHPSEYEKFEYLPGGSSKPRQKKIHFLLYQDPERGHSPPSKLETLGMLRWTSIK